MPPRRGRNTPASKMNVVNIGSRSAVRVMRLPNARQSEPPKTTGIVAGSTSLYITVTADDSVPRSSRAAGHRTSRPSSLGYCDCGAAVSRHPVGLESPILSLNLWSEATFACRLFLTYALSRMKKLLLALLQLAVMTAKQSGPVARERSPRRISSSSSKHHRLRRRLRPGPDLARCRVIERHSYPCP